MERDVLSVREVAERLGLNVKSVYSGIRVGEIPSLRVGGRILIPRAALARLLDQAPGAAA